MTPPPIHPGVSRGQIYCQTIMHVLARNAGLYPALGHWLLPAMERDTYSIPCPMGQNWWRVFILYSKIKTKQKTHTQRNRPWSLDTPTLILYWLSSNVTWCCWFFCGVFFPLKVFTHHRMNICAVFLFLLLSIILFIQTALRSSKVRASKVDLYLTLEEQLTNCSHILHSWAQI